MKLITTRWSMTCAKMKSAKARSGLMFVNSFLFCGFTCIRKHTETEQEPLLKYLHKVTKLREINVFTRVCHSVHEGCLPLPACIIGNITRWACLLKASRQTPHPPLMGYSQAGNTVNTRSVHTYWNAFLFIRKLFTFSP